ncbi:hypothetical protein [Brevibacillus agri]|uniref:hypothetical protein n=1 Tax=Brevibacillus agri TaxID=51101 RepID=UPI001C8D3E45|nr:hypothetical protein [Brevibacillus agri]MBY0054801.1 hypothetical protein [Brevibacillus agri]MCG5253897.1 hypothetical protein [Brevibacillus agri]MDR9503269.1 hypothetical protein [Brevibacillus agri]
MKRYQTDGERQLSQLFSREHVVLGQYMEKLKKLVYQNRSNHLLLLCLPFLPHVPALVSVIFLPGVVKMAIAAKGVKLPVKTVGIMEIGNVLWFLAGGYVLLAV